MKHPFAKYFVYVAVFAGNVLAFVAGTCLSWSSPILAKLKNANLTDNPLGREITPTEESWLGSLAALGAIFGPFIFGLASNKIGKKLVLIILGLPFAFAYVMMACAGTIEIFLVSRILIGLALGGVFTVIPLYIGEVAEDKNRGALGSSMNCFVTFGLLFSYCLGPYIDMTVYHILLAVIPAGYTILFAFTAPESPYFLIDKDANKAEITLKQIRGILDVSNELKEIQTNVEKSKEGTVLEMFKSKALRRAFCIGVGLLFFQQFSGINAVLFYGQNIFESAGGSLPTPVGPIIVGVVQFLASFVTPFTSDRFGRKILLLVSCAGMCISEVLLGAFFYVKDSNKNIDHLGWLPITSLVLYIVFYNIAVGPIPWAILGELFSPNVKGFATAVVASICWVFGFIVTQWFSSVSDFLGKGPTFWIFASFCLIGAVFVKFYVIETKGKSLKEIQDKLNE